MCELLGLSSNTPATVNFSLPNARCARRRIRKHIMAAGASAIYEGQDVRLIKEATPESRTAIGFGSSQIMTCGAR